ncbi:monovalent cation/H+ antiporter subunit D [Halomonas elongata]|uniref:Monovalent cation/H+ antiporter subunit D n=1 Tax=Halomonas elongata (strain ATCC 33173 / DSM 2581 / NBRC 15536 / NCIMB 2198 / 1H9) TaxID=768066 RepID=E1V721_HALED|nr:monovalent cation/H+ antiporter subunit D [Halomonas elongata]MBW5799515.1 monovalent cation/H+ antiporter subunit D [Halomonas elongata]MDL4862221.1 monovalent cation/H+ antiporter subunit D [Halomonas elongata]RAW09039.1 monovalent cation/H+ antiporter subunit D [Halomonas elongata]WBF17148.1 monovalent cation/H+ antiporter subunit D [Halomonas elongata]WPU45982.1 monovalent cation/H+ antiporter subunit D [Halomonas elongata DSM 2581]
MIQHLIVLPIVLPLIVGIVLLRSRFGSSRFKRIASVIATLALAAISLALLLRAADGEIAYYALGGWQPPFGIVLVLDRLSALMVMLTSVLAIGCVIFACGGDDEKGSNFHGLFQLQLMGINGAFLTGDLFNLFVFFEVLLLASYALLLHGGGKSRIQSAVHYVVLNLAGSALFLIAVGVLYGATGTLNMADMAARLGELPAERSGLVTAGALLLLVVFGLKAAILPLYFWLPRAYAAAPAPVAALFAIMTKVGVYAILRVYSLIFGQQAGELASLEQPWVWWLALATLVAATIGVLAARDLRLLVAYLVLVSAGTLLAGVGMDTPEATASLLYYLVHTTLVTGGLFLLADMIGQQRGKAGTRIVKGRPLVQGGALAGLFFLGASAVAGLPPLSGAIGKALLMHAADAGQRPWLWPILLISGLCAIIALSRAGSTLFWRSNEGEPGGDRLPRQQWIGVTLLLATSPLLVALAGPVSDYTRATADQLANPDALVSALLPDNGGAP